MMSATPWLTKLGAVAGRCAYRAGKFLTIAGNTAGGPTGVPSIGADMAPELETSLSGGNYYDVLGGVPAKLDGYRDTMSQYAYDVAMIFDACLRSPTTLNCANGGNAPLLGLSTSSSAVDILKEIARQMVSKTPAIQRLAQASAVVWDTRVNQGVTYDVDNNTGNGRLMWAPYLDGYNAPSSGWPSHWLYGSNSTDANPPVVYWPGDGGYPGPQKSQLVSPTERFVFDCATDSYADGVDVGSETFTLAGSPVPRRPYDWMWEGSGTGPTVICSESLGLIASGDLENWSSDTTPVPWDGTNTSSKWVLGVSPTALIAQNDSTTGNTNGILRGSSSVVFTGVGASSGVIATIPIAATLDPIRGYFFSFWYKMLTASKPTNTSSYIQVTPNGTGYSYTFQEATVSATSDRPTHCSSFYVEDLTAIAADTWHHVYFFFVTPESVPTDFSFSLTVEGLDAGKKIYMDAFSLVPAVYHGGYAFGVASGSAGWQRNDRIMLNSPAATSSESKIMEMLRRVYHYQLPAVPTYYATELANPTDYDMP